MPESAPTKVVAVRAAVVASYVNPPSVFGARLPVAESNMAIEEVASVESTTVTVEARVARSIVMLFGTSASEMEAQVKSPDATIEMANWFAAQSAGFAASAPAVVAVIVPLPDVVRELPVPTTSAAVVLVAPVTFAKETESAAMPVIPRC